MPLTKSQLGNHLQQTLWDQKQRLFELGRSAQLAYSSFTAQITQLETREESEITINFPVGLRPDGSVMTGTETYNKERLKNDYQHLANIELSTTLVYNLVTQTEVLLSDLLSAILQVYPAKLGTKRQVSAAIVFQADTLEYLRDQAIASVCNELAYKSPKEYAECVSEFFGFDICNTIVQYPRYQELKATRDILIHNRGVANEIYSHKAGSHARARVGQSLPVNIGYFLSSYEICLSMNESLMERFHDVWPSPDYEQRKAWNESQNNQSQMALPDPFAAPQHGDQSPS